MKKFFIFSIFLVQIFTHWEFTRDDCNDVPENPLAHLTNRLNDWENNRLGDSRYRIRISPKCGTYGERRFKLGEFSSACYPFSLIPDAESIIVAKGFTERVDIWYSGGINGPSLRCDCRVGGECNIERAEKSIWDSIDNYYDAPENEYIQERISRHVEGLTTETKYWSWKNICDKTWCKEDSGGIDWKWWRRSVIDTTRAHLPYSKVGSAVLGFVLIAFGGVLLILFVGVILLCLYFKFTKCAKKEKQ